MLCGSTAFHGFASVAESFAVVTFDLSICRGGVGESNLKVLMVWGEIKRLKGTASS